MDNGNSRRQKQGGVSVLLMLLATSFCSSHTFAAGPTLRFDIPAGDSVKSLGLFNTQSKIEMLYITDQVQGRMTRPVSGDLELTEALRQLLEGTDLEFQFENDYSFVFIKPKPRPEEIGPATPLDRQADALPPNAHHKLFEVSKLFGQDDLQEVVVTGTLIHGVFDISSPLAMYTKRQMKQSSYWTVQDALEMSPLNYKGSLSEDAGGVGNFARGVSANLRGLGPGATLVLINGHRQPFSGNQGDFVDISSIPWSAVDRIEILPDGASAIYGSDAIAGVVNVIMRKELAGAESLLRYGAAPGGAQEKLIGQLFGTDWHGGNVLFSYQYSHRTALDASERFYAANTDKRSFGGSDFRTPMSSPGTIFNPFTQAPAYAIPSGQDGSALTAAELIPGANLYNRYSTIQLLPDKQTHSVFITSKQELNDRFSLFAEGRLSQRDVQQRLYGYDTVLFVPATNPYAAQVNPFSGVPFMFVGYNFVDDFGPMVLTSSARTYGGTLGLNSSFGESWRVTLSGSYGRETTRYEVNNQPDFAKLDAALSDTNPATAFNPFGSGLHNNPQTLESIRLLQTNDAASTLTGGTLVADGVVAELPGGSARLAIGSEWRKEQFEQNVVGLHGAFDRSVKSAFAELSIPIIGNPEDARAAPRLELSLAGRYESYSDFGNTANPRFGLRWAPTRSLKLRGSWGTSFRAPKLVDVYDTSGNVALLANFRDPLSSTGQSIVLARTGSNQDLRQETATTWTAGLDLAPDFISGFTASLTYYSIAYEHRIETPGGTTPLQILLQENQWAEAITRDPSQSAIDAICNSAVFRGSATQCQSTPIAAIVDLRVRNLAATKVNGLDMRLDHSLQTTLGRLKTSLDGAYLLRYEQSVSNTSPMVNIVNTVGNPTALRLRGTVEWYERDWDLPGFGVTLALDHRGGYEDLQRSAGLGVNALTTVDCRLSYRTGPRATIADDVEVALNAANVFNRAPPFANLEAGYDIQNAEPYGRVISLSIQKNW